MNAVLLLFVLGANGSINTSFCTYHKIGGYSISDLYLNYVLRRYDFKIVLEKRENDYGLKSVTLEIDSIANGWRLSLGEKPYHIRAPGSTNLNIWGLAMSSRGADLFVGKMRDYTTSLPPTFKENKYTLGARLRRQISYRIPVDFYLVRRCDSTGENRISSNNAIGVNSEVGIGDRLYLDSQLWTSLSDIGVGASFALNGRYATQKYGGYFHYTTISDNYVALSSIESLRSSWLRVMAYQKPLGWLSLSQDFSYASQHESRVILNTRLERATLPSVIYSVGFSRDVINQAIESDYRYKDFAVSANYEWSRERCTFGGRIAQRIANCQIWSSFQSRDLDVWQFGFSFPFARYFRAKCFMNYAMLQDYQSHTTGLDLSARFLMDFYLHATYEFVHHNSVSDQIISFSISKTLDFNAVGLSFISGYVFMDVNSNGLFDASDRPVPDVTVVLDGDSEVQTNRDGRYMFSFVKSGKHTIRVNLGCVPAEIGTAERTRTIDTRLLSQVQMDFPLEVLGSISGTIYFDDNNSGEMDDDETGVPNVVVALNGYLTTTDENGSFRFANLASGTYTLEPKVLPPKTAAARQEMIYVYIQPGSHFADYRLGLVKQERPVNKKIFD